MKAAPAPQTPPSGATADSNGHRLADAFLRLAPTSRALRYPAGYADASLSLIDAVYSMNAHYTGVLRVVHRYARTVGIDVVAYGRTRRRPEHRVSDLVRSLEGRDAEALATDVFGNRSRGSGRLKALLVANVARNLVSLGVDGQEDLAPQDTHAYERQKGAWTAVHGLGPATWRYFRLLNGKEDVKPDRMLQRWVQAALCLPNIPSASATVALLEDLRRTLEARWGQRVSRRAIDQTIWFHESGRAPPTKPAAR